MLAAFIVKAVGNWVFVVTCLEKEVRDVCGDNDYQLRHLFNLSLLMRRLRLFLALPSSFYLLIFKVFIHLF